MSENQNQLCLHRPASKTARQAKNQSPPTRIRRRCLAGLVGCLLLWHLDTARSLAGTSYWNNAGGGSFNDSVNWNGGLPGPSDTAYFSSNATYQVTWAANATNQSAYVTGGFVTNAIGSATWRITGQYNVGQSTGATGSVRHVSGTLIVTNSQGTGTIASGQSANRNYTLEGGTAVADYLNFVDDGAVGWSRFMECGTLTTLHGASLSVGNDLVFAFPGGKVGTWNMLGGTTTSASTSAALLYTQLGWAWDSQYIINVSGPTTVWNNVLYLVVGNIGNGHQINISGGAKVASADSWIGRYGSADSVTVDGTNSVWNIQSLSFGSLQGYGNLFLSENALGCKLVITNGGQVNSGLATITRYTSGTGNSVLVTGGNSLWNISTNLVVGDYGTSNRVTISNGGRINCQIAYMGGSASSTATGAAMNNSMLVTDTNSLLNATNGVRVGSFAGKCSFLLTNGGYVLCGSGTVVGSQSAATNDLVVITGAGSLWTNSSTFTVGSFGANNSMTISNGGQLCNTRGIVGSGSASNLVVVTGAGSLWNNGTDLYIGNLVNALGNQLLVSNNATVLTTNLVVSVSSSALSNLVTVAGGNLFATNASQLGNLDVRRGTLNLLSGLVEADRLFLTNGSSSGFKFSGGRLNARNSTVNNAQPFAIGSGTNWAQFNLKGGIHSFANGLSVSSNAWLTGGGTISGNVTNAGVLAPDASFGDLNINGAVQLQPNSDLAFDIGGYSAGGNYDYLSASGSIVWNGRLYVTLAPGFVPNPADVFTIAQCAGDSGSFINVASGGTLHTADNLGSFVVTYGNSALQLSQYHSLSPTSSNFKLAVPNAGQGSVTLQFPFAFGQTYHLWFSTNLVSWTELLVPGYLLPQPGVGQWTDDGSLTSSAPFNSRSPRFYRISFQ
jgi:fibronectin-binding autotransporter adhesin